MEVLLYLVLSFHGPLLNYYWTWIEAECYVVWHMMEQSYCIIIATEEKARHLGTRTKCILKATVIYSLHWKSISNASSTPNRFAIEGDQNTLAGGLGGKRLDMSHNIYKLFLPILW